jgi:hypothetical protein
MESHAKTLPLLLFETFGKEQIITFRVIVVRNNV